MDYEILVRQFFQLDLEYSFTPNEVAIYFHLINRCSIISWKNPFGLSCDDLRAKIKCKNAESKTAFDTARNRLKQAGLIEFKNGLGRGNVTQYTLKLIKGVQKQPFSMPFSDTFSIPFSTPATTNILSDCNSDSIKKEEERREIVFSMFKSVRGELTVEVLRKEVGMLLNKRPDINPSVSRDQNYINAWAKHINPDDHHVNGSTGKKMVY